MTNWRQAQAQKERQKRREANLIERKKTAVHEAAHAVADELLRHGIEYVTIEPTTKATCTDPRRAACIPDGVVSLGFEQPKPPPANAIESLETKLVCELVGGMAEDLFFGEYPKEESRGDIQKLHDRITMHFLPKEELEALVADAVPDEHGHCRIIPTDHVSPEDRQAIIKTSVQKAMEFVRDRHDLIQSVANRLLSSDRLTGDEVRKICQSEEPQQI